MSLLLRGGCVVTGDAKETVWNPGDVLVEGERIARVGPSDPGARADEVVDCRNHILIPGLINSHSHIEEILQRSMRDNTPMEPWFAYKAAIESAMDLGPDAWYSVVALAAIEMLSRGVTTVLHHYFCRPVLKIENTDAVIRAYEDAGMRVFLAPAITDVGVYDTLPIDLVSLPPALQEEVRATTAPPLEPQVEATEEIFRRLVARAGRVRPMVGPSAPQRSTEKLLRVCLDLSERFNCRIHTHSLETRSQVITCTQLYGRPLFEYLEAFGFLSERTSFAHCVWLTPKEIEIMGRRGVSVAHNPCSNMKLGDGMAPVHSLLRAGANVALGTDGGDTSDTYSILDQMKAAALMHSLPTYETERWLSANEAFRMGTRNGAKLLGMEAEIGSLEPGKRADVVVLRRGLGLYPLNNVIRQIVYCENGASVDQVYIDGRAVVRDGRVTGVDTPGVLSAIDEIAARMHRMLPEAAAPAARWESYLLAVHHQACREYERRR